MNCVSWDICVYHLWFVFFPGEFPSSRVTGACPVTTDLIMRVNVRTTIYHAYPTDHHENLDTRVQITQIVPGQSTCAYMYNPGHAHDNPDHPVAYYCAKHALRLDSDPIYQPRRHLYICRSVKMICVKCTVIWSVGRVNYMEFDIATGTMSVPCSTINMVHSRRAPSRIAIICCLFLSVRERKRDRAKDWHLARAIDGQLEAHSLHLIGAPRDRSFVFSGASRPRLAFVKASFGLIILRLV